MEINILLHVQNQNTSTNTKIRYCYHSAQTREITDSLIKEFGFPCNLGTVVQIYSLTLQHQKHFKKLQLYVPASSYTSLLALSQSYILRKAINSQYTQNQPHSKENLSKSNSNLARMREQNSNLFL